MLSVVDSRMYHLEFREKWQDRSFLFVLSFNLRFKYEFRDLSGIISLIALLVISSSQSVGVDV